MAERKRQAERNSASHLECVTVVISRFGSLKLTGTKCWEDTTIDEICN